MEVVAVERERVSGGGIEALAGGDGGDDAGVLHDGLRRVAVNWFVTVGISEQRGLMVERADEVRGANDFLMYPLRFLAGERGVGVAMALHIETLREQGPAILAGHEGVNASVIRMRWITRFEVVQRFHTDDLQICADCEQSELVVLRPR